MNNNTTAVEREKAETTFNATSEYKIGHTIYTVTTVFNPASKESLPDILKRLIIRESEKLLGESGQEPEKQAVLLWNIGALYLFSVRAIMIT